MAGWVKRVVGQGQKEESNRHIMHTGNLLDSVQLSQHHLQMEGKDEDGDGETDLFLIQHL